MQIRTGIPVSHGVAHGPALVFDSQGFRIPQRFVSIDAVQAELGRFHTALDRVSAAIEENERLALERLGPQYSAVFAAHRQMIRDPNVVTEIETLIRDKCYSPEHAAGRVFQHWARKFEGLGGNRYLQQRATDLRDLEKRLVRELLGERHEELTNLTTPVVILAHNLMPSETANLDPEYILGFATEAGGRTSHTAILAGALGIPAVVGVGPFLSELTGGETVIIDCTSGEVVIDPDENRIATSLQSEEKFRVFSERLNERTREQPVTGDGHTISILGNIEFPDEVKTAKKRGAKGIGLYRTEFLYLEQNREPTEQEHYEAYCKVVSAFPEEPVTIRTLDLGADKIPASFRQLSQSGTDTNLGLRSIRVSLQHLDLFQTQLRAILRAAVFGDVRIMFPLVTTLQELRQAKHILHNVIEDLEHQNVDFKRDVQVGMMVEVPAAALMAREFAREVDFFSIGTNDLIQYALACDRSDPAVAHLYRSSDPAVLRLIKMVVDAAEEVGIEVTVCGQMSADPIYLPLLIGLGIRSISVTPFSIPELKEVMRRLSVSRAEEITERVMQKDLAQDIEAYLRGELEVLCPDIYV